MFFQRVLYLTLTVLLAATTVQAGTGNYNPTGEGCVDPKGFLTCYQNAVTSMTGCAEACNATTTVRNDEYKLCLTGCNGAQLATNLACWVQSCWNQLYSCEHQLAVISYFQGNEIVQNESLFPWFPPPSNAVDGACSCNLGYVEGNMTIQLSELDYNTPCMNVAGDGDFNKLHSCNCCESSLPVSNILNQCPTQDLSILDVPNFITHAQGLISDSTDSCAILNTGDIDSCKNTFGYVFLGSQVYNPLSFPTGVPGNEPLSNHPGNAFTDFGAPAFTFSIFPGFSSVVTPVKFNSAAGAVSGTVDAGSVIATPTGTLKSTGGVVGSRTVSGTKATLTTSGGSPSSTSKPASGTALSVDRILMLGSLMAGLAVIL